MRFTIRDVLWLVLVASLGCGWWADRRQKQQAIESANDRAWKSECRVRELDGFLAYQHGLNASIAKNRDLQERTLDRMRKEYMTLQTELAALKNQNSN